MSLYEAMKARVALDFYILSHWWFVWLAIFIVALLLFAYERNNE